MLRNPTIRPAKRVRFESEAGPWSSDAQAAANAIVTQPSTSISLSQNPKRKRMNILFVDDNAEIRDLLIFSLLSHTDFQYKEAANGRDAMDLLSQEKFDLVISDLNMPNGSGADVYRHLKTIKHSARLAVVGNEPIEKAGEIAADPDVFYIRKPFKFENLQKVIDQVIAENVSQSPKDYIPVTINFLRRIGHLVPPLFIRLNDFKFVRILNSNHTFTQEDFDKYTQRGVSELYVETVMANSLIEAFAKKAFSNDAWQEAGTQNHDHIHINADLVRAIVAQMNWPDEKIHHVLDSAKRALHIIRSQPTLAKVFQQFQKIEKWGLSDHAALILTMAAGLSDSLGHGDTETMQKLTYSALLHDMTLSDQQYDNKAKLIERAKKSENHQFKDVKDVLDHPALASQICKTIQVCPPDVDQIIFDHHERPDGKGFPMGKRAEEIPFLSALMIFCEDFTETFIDCAGHVDVAGFARARAQIYGQGHFKLILEAFKNATTTKTQIAS